MRRRYEKTSSASKPWKKQLRSNFLMIRIAKADVFKFASNAQSMPALQPKRSNTKLYVLLTAFSYKSYPDISST